MPPEEESSLIVCQSDSLRGHLKVDDCRNRKWPHHVQLLHGSPNGLRTGQGLRVQREEVQDIAR